MKMLYINKAEKKIYSFPEHSHDSWEILMTLEGIGEEIIDGRRYGLKRKSILCIPPHSIHSTLSKEGILDFSAAFEDFVPIKNNTALQLWDRGRGDAYRLMDMLLLAVRHRPDNVAMLTDALSDSLYQLLCAYSNESSKTNRVISKMKAYFMEHLSDTEFDMGDALDSFGYSQAYLRRIFKDVTGHSPIDWLNLQRIDQAARSFRQYPKIMTIKETALRYGFSDPYYFSRVFKKYMKKSPSEYLKENLDAEGGYEAMPPNSLSSHSK